MKLVDDLGRSFDKRLIATSSFYTQVNTGKVSDDEFREYKENVREWMREFSSFKSKIYHYFGPDEMLLFENEVHRNIREISDITLRTYKYGKENLSRRDLKEHEEVRDRLNIARHVAFKFLRELNEKIASDDIGRTKMFDNIHVGKLDLISRSYLIQRLLGLKS